MQMTPQYEQLSTSQLTDQLLLPPTGIGWIQEWYNHWCMILNPYKIKAFVASRTRPVNPPHSDLVLSSVSIRPSSNLNILGVKFDSNLTL